MTREHECVGEVPHNRCVSEPSEASSLLVGYLNSIVWPSAVGVRVGRNGNLTVAEGATKL